MVGAATHEVEASLLERVDDPAGRVIVQAREQPIDFSVRTANKSVNGDGHFQDKISHDVSAYSDEWRPVQMDIKVLKNVYWIFKSAVPQALEGARRRPDPAGRARRRHRRQSRSEESARKGSNRSPAAGGDR